MQVTEYVAQQTVRMTKALTHFVQTMLADWLDWQPVAASGETRFVLNQVNECIHTNRIVAAVLRGKTGAEQVTLVFQALSPGAYRGRCKADGGDSCICGGQGLEHNTACLRGVKMWVTRTQKCETNPP